MKALAGLPQFALLACQMRKLRSGLAGALSRRTAGAGALMRQVGEDAIDGARGNSGDQAGQPELRAARQGARTPLRAITTTSQRI